MKNVFIFAALLLAPAYALDRPGVTFKVFQFPADRIPRIDGNADDWKIVPAGPRPFPAQMRDSSVAAASTPGPVPLPIAGIAFGGLLGAGALVRRRKQKRAAK